MIKIFMLCQLEINISCQMMQCVTFINNDTFFNKYNYNTLMMSKYDVMPNARSKIALLKLEENLKAPTVNPSHSWASKKTYM